MKTSLFLLSTHFLKGDTISRITSERSLMAYCIDKLLRDLMFLAKGLKDQVSILLSVTVNDGTKFIDVFTDFHFGQKNTEVVVTLSSLESIKDCLHRFYRHDTNQLEDMIINYKIKFCYFSKSANKDKHDRHPRDTPPLSRP